MELDFTSFSSTYDSYQNNFESIIKTACSYLNVRANLIISVTIVDNEFIHNLNKNYRNIDKPTDVISFAFLDGTNQKETLPQQKGDVVLGEIYISYEQAEIQAREYGHSIEREMDFLFVHGLLHLFGYDHIKLEDEKIMFPLQEIILNLTKEKLHEHQ